MLIPNASLKVPPNAFLTDKILLSCGKANPNITDKMIEAFVKPLYISVALICSIKSITNICGITAMNKPNNIAGIEKSMAWIISKYLNDVCLKPKALNIPNSYVFESISLTNNEYITNPPNTPSNKTELKNKISKNILMNKNPRIISATGVVNVIG